MVVDAQSEHVPILRGEREGGSEGGREEGRKGGREGGREGESREEGGKEGEREGGRERGREGGRREGGMERAIAVCVAVDGVWSVILEHFLSIAGRGMKNGENFKLLYDLADKLGAGGIPYICVFFFQTDAALE